MKRCIVCVRVCVWAGKLGNCCELRKAVANLWQQVRKAKAKAKVKAKVKAKANALCACVCVCRFCVTIFKQTDRHTHTRVLYMYLLKNVQIIKSQNNEKLPQKITKTRAASATSNRERKRAGEHARN